MAPTLETVALSHEISSLSGPGRDMALPHPPSSGPSAKPPDPATRVGKEWVLGISLSTPR